MSKQENKNNNTESSINKPTAAEKCDGSFVTMCEWHQEQGRSLKNHKMEYDLVTYSQWCNEREVTPKKTPATSFEVVDTRTTTNATTYLRNTTSIEDITTNQTKIECLDNCKTIEQVSLGIEDKKKEPIVEEDTFVFTEKHRGWRLLLDVAVVLICLSGSIISGYFFYNAVNRSLEKVGEEPIASISFKYKSAQRKMDDRVLWDRVKQNTPLYDGDIIRTAEISEATITFPDGNVVDLFEQTLVQVFYDENGVEVGFSGGEIAINTANSVNGLVLSSGDTKVQVEANATLHASAKTDYVDGNLTKVDDAPIALQVLVGNANLVDTLQTEESRLLEAGTTMLVDSTNDITISPISVLAPVPNGKYLRSSNETKKVDFIFEKADTEQEITLQVSKQKDFLEIAHQTAISESNTVSYDLDDGFWYWRFINNAAQSIDEGKFSLISSEPTQTMVPILNEEFAYRSKNPPIRFIWSDDPNASQWVLEVANNERMQNPVFVQTTTQPSSIVSVLGEGTWYWRVTTEYPNSILYNEESLAPASNVFSISKKGELNPTNLLYPAKNGVIDISQDAPNVYFSWERDIEPVSYTLRLSKTENFSSNVIEKNITTNYLPLNELGSDLSEGIWFWDVAKTDVENNMSKNSDIQPFLALEGGVVLDVLEPQNGYVSTVSEISSVDFSWANNLPFRTYLQVASDVEFTNTILETEVFSESTTDIELPSGRWYWRIVSQTDDKAISYASDAKELYVDFTLSNVTQNYPRVNESLVIAPNERTSFTWTEVENAEYYAFKLFSTANRQQPVFESLNVQTSRVSVNMNTMPEGSYFWTVQAFANNTPSLQPQQSTIASRNIRMRKLQFVSLEEFPNNGQVDGVSALLNPPTVTWKSEEELSSTEFILTKVNRGLTANSRLQGIEPRESDIELRISNPTNTIQLPPLDSGIWYWTVLAEAESGFDITPSEPVRFVVDEIEQLPASILTPEDNTLFDLDYLLHNKSIDFSWNAIDTADTYILTITAEDGSVIVQELLKDTQQFAFTDLHLLDRGNFYWSVEANRNLPDGTLQKGIVSKNMFIIDLPVVTAPQNLTVEQMYGL